MNALLWIFNDGGRALSGFKGFSGDCVCRAISIATGASYLSVYEKINQISQQEKKSKTRRGKSNSRNGVHKVTYRKLLESLGWKWTPTMGIGTGCKVHLRQGELPKGKLIVEVSRHLVAVVDGVIQDTFDCSRDGMRCVYGYWS
jgi:hypothetical protein